MALDLSTLTKYVDEHKMPLTRKALLEGRTINLIFVQPGIKHSATLNQFATTVELQAGGCGFNPTNTTEVSQRTLTVCPIKDQESLCPYDMEEYFLQKGMNPGSYPVDMKPIDGIYAEEKAAKIQEAIELIAWQGDTVSGSGNLALCDGFLKISDDDATFITAGTGSITPADVIDQVNAVVAATPVDIIASENKIIFMGYDAFNTYTQALVAANLFHYKPTDGQPYTYQVPGSDVMAVAVKGLNGTNEMFFTYATNLVMGTDLVNDFEDFRVWWSQDDQEVKYTFQGKLGFQIAYPDFVVRHLAS